MLKELYMTCESINNQSVNNFIYVSRLFSLNKLIEDIIAKLDNIRIKLVCTDVKMKLMQHKCFYMIKTMYKHIKTIQLL